MKFRKTLWIAAGLFLVLTACQPVRQGAVPRGAEASPAADILPYAIHEQQLDNGLHVVTVPFNSPGLAAFYIIVRVGSRHEVEAGKSGFAHFFEHMMFRGTGRYSRDQYNEELKAIGAAANANTWWDRTVYHMTGNAGKLEKMFELESDRFQFLKYSEADFREEAGAVRGEYTRNMAAPPARLSEKTYQTAFRQHTYGHTTMGFREDIVDMPNQYDYSLEFFNRFYRPEYTTILVVGDVRPDRVNELARRYFGNWKRGQYQAQIPMEPAQQETRYAHIRKADFPPYIGLNYKGPAFSTSAKDKAALDVLARMMFSKRSPLYRKLVVQERKARNLQAGGLDFADPGLFTFSATLLKAADVPAVKEQIEAVLDSLKSNPVDESLLRQTKDNMRYAFSMGLDNPTSIAEALTYYIWLTGNPKALNQAYALYESVTHQDIMAAARKYFVPERLTISTISPAEEEDVFKEQMKVTGR